MSNNSKILSAYSARLLFENILLRVIIQPLYMATSNLGYVFMYSCFKNIFSLLVASLHYHWSKNPRSFRLLTPAVLATDPIFRKILARANKQPYLYSLFESFIGLMLMGYCFLLSTIASSTSLSFGALSLLWLVQKSPNTKKSLAVKSDSLLSRYSQHTASSTESSTQVQQPDSTIKLNRG